MKLKEEIIIDVKPNEKGIYEPVKITKKKRKQKKYKLKKLKENNKNYLIKKEIEKYENQFILGFEKGIGTIKNILDLFV